MGQGLRKNQMQTDRHPADPTETARQGAFYAPEIEISVPYSRIQITLFQCCYSQNVWNLIDLKMLATLLARFAPFAK